MSVPIDLANALTAIGCTAFEEVGVFPRYHLRVRGGEDKAIAETLFLHLPIGVTGMGLMEGDTEIKVHNPFRDVWVSIYFSRLSE